MRKEDVKEAIKEAMTEVFTAYGFTVDAPSEIQQDMAHLRKLRLGCEATKRTIAKAVITATVPAALYIIWQTIRGILNGKVN